MVQNKLYEVKISEEAQRGLGRIVSFVALNSIQAAKLLKKGYSCRNKFTKNVPGENAIFRGRIYSF